MSAWATAIPIIISLLQSVLKGGGDREGDLLERGQEAQNVLGRLGMEKPYQSPYVAGLDKTMIQALLNNMGRYANFGMGEDMQMDTSFIDELLASIGAGGTGGPGGMKERKEGNPLLGEGPRLRTRR